MQLHPVAGRPQHVPRHMSRYSYPGSQLLGRRDQGGLGVWRCFSATFSRCRVSDMFLPSGSQILRFSWLGAGSCLGWGCCPICRLGSKKAGTSGAWFAGAVYRVCPPCVTSISRMSGRRTCSCLFSTGRSHSRRVASGISQLGIHLLTRLRSFVSSSLPMSAILRKEPCLPWLMAFSIFLIAPLWRLMYRLFILCAHILPECGPQSLAVGSEGIYLT